MKKILSGILSAVLLSIFIINCPESFGQRVFGEESSRCLDLNSYFLNPSLIWPYQTISYLNTLPYWEYQASPLDFLYANLINIYEYNAILNSSLGYVNSWASPWNYAYKHLMPKFLKLDSPYSNSSISETAQGEAVVCADTEEWVPFNGLSSVSPPTMSVPTSTMQEVVLDIQIPGMKVRQKVEDGITYQQVSMAGSGSITEIGKPQLPMISKCVPIPSGATIEVEVVDSAFNMREEYMIYPSQEPVPATEDATIPPFMLDEAQYQRDEFYPHEIVEIEGPSVIRGCSMVILRVYPIQFNPVKETLRIYSHIRIKVSFQGGEGHYVEDRLRSSSFDKTFSRLFGSDSIEAIEQGLDAAFDYGNCLVIITHPDFLVAAQTLADWKIKKGIYTLVTSTDDISARYPGKPNAEEITTYIQEAYDTWSSPPTHLLLIGDAEFVPCHYKTEHIDEFEGLIGTDLYYATLDGTDYFPDISVGRLSVDTLAQANKRIRDIISYEKASVLDEDFYTHAACASVFQDKDYNQVEDLRFVLTSEDINGHLTDNGFDVDRIYYAYDSVEPKYWLESAWPWPYNPLPLEERELPLELQRPNFAWDGDAYDISSAVNSGRFLLTHVGHGSQFRWADPLYKIFHIEALENGDKLPVVWSINCMTGWFDNETDNPVFDISPAHKVSFSEAWERNPNGGAIGVIAGTRTSYCIHSDRLIWGWMDAIWPDFNPDYTPSGTYFDDPQFEMGQVLNYGKLYYASLHQESDVRQLEFEVFHWFGDPTMQIWTGVPQELDVYHSTAMWAETAYFEVDVSEPGALICISKESQILGRAWSTGSTVTVPLTCSIKPGEAIDITVTKHNFRPYQGRAACGPLGFRLKLTQDHTQVVQGDTLAYWVDAVNDINQVQNVSFAVNVTLPNGQIYPGPGYYLEGPFEITFNPHEVKSVHLEFPISDLAPVGLCTWHGYILNESGQVFWHDEFKFNIIPPLTVYAIPDTTKILRSGGTITYQVTITNQTDSYQDVAFATNITLPDKNIYPIPPAYHLGPIDLITLSAYESRTALIELPVPRDMPLGVYTYNCYVLGSKGIIHQSGFDITIVGYLTDPTAASSESNYLIDLAEFDFNTDELISGDLGFCFPGYNSGE